MGTQSQIDDAPHETRIPEWSLIKRIAFRFCFAYLGLFCIFAAPLSGLLRLTPSISVPILTSRWPMRQITSWTASHVFRVATPLVLFSGSGDKTFDWVGVFCLLMFAVFATGIWSILDRRREHYVTLHKWFRLFIRLALASVMFTYGMGKVIPLQMPFPALTRWVEPFGNFTPMGVLWNFIGASPRYEIFTGALKCWADSCCWPHKPRCSAH